MPKLLRESDIQLLKTEISKLERNGNYETLLRQANLYGASITYNAAQLAFAQWGNQYQDIALVWGRGTGKTTIIAKRMIDIVTTMPKSSNMIIVPSYKKFMYEMLPSLKYSLEMHGYFEGLHYFVGKKPPPKARYDVPWKSPETFQHVIYFYNGAIFNLVSQDVEGSGRGLNIDCAIGDECAMLDKVKLDATTTATMRGSNVAAFEDKQLFGSKLWLTSMPITPKGKWVLDYKRLQKERPNKYWYLAANVYINSANLRKGFIDDARETALYKWLYEAEYENIEPSTVLEMFYTNFRQDKHAYSPIMSGYFAADDCRYDSDLDPNLPLLIGIDWGARINYAVVCQEQMVGGRRTLRALKNFYALSDDGEIQSDMVKKIADYYKPRLNGGNSQMFLFYDVSGNVKTGMTYETRAEQAQIQLSSAGYDVELQSLGGRYPSHAYRRFFWETICSEKNMHLPIFRVNNDRCGELVISMLNTKVKRQGRDLTKDKSDERAESQVHPTHASHPSDAIDYIAIALYGDEVSMN